MLPADSGGGGSADLKRGLEALTTFKKRVDGVLSTFTGSAGSSTKVEAQRISRASFSGAGKFDEASGLYTQYHRVHESLTSLSKTLSMQIEALQIAVHGADIGFDNLEEDQRQRFWEIQTEVGREHAQAQSDKKLADDDQAEGGY